MNKQEVLIMTTYLDCNATTPTEPEVVDALLSFLADEYGNAGSRTHEMGLRAKRAVEEARRKVGAVVDAHPDEVIFTGGATESNNLAILGLARGNVQGKRRHIVTTQLEHKAVLEPIQALVSEGYEVTTVQSDASGRISADEVLGAIRADTLLVSIMHSNNETGVIQPIAEIANMLSPDGPFMHVDAAQTYGKELTDLKLPRIDLISVSGHKIYAPKGIGALILRKRNGGRAPLKPIMYGGGQERGLRPGTLPVHLIVGLGKAAEIAVRDNAARRKRCVEIRKLLLESLTPLGFKINGDAQWTQPHVANLSFPNVDSEAAMLALKGLVAVSNGSACTSSSYEPSHVLVAMGMTDDQVENAIRFSWCHMTPDFDYQEVANRLKTLM